MKREIKVLLSVGACMLSLSTYASAGSMTLYDNLALPPGPNGAPIGNGNAGLGVPGLGPLADSFSTTTAGTLSDVQLELQLMGVATGQITAYLYSDTGAPSPGTSLYTLGTIVDSSVSNSGSIIDLSGLSYALAANTRYWIYLADSSAPGTPGTSLWWYAEATNAGTGVAGEYNYTAGATPQVIANNDFVQYGTGPYQMSVTINTTAIPEPTSAVLLGIGFAGSVLVVGRVRRQRRAA
jgi:hypothetical protein